MGYEFALDGHVHIWEWDNEGDRRCVTCGLVRDDDQPLPGLIFSPLPPRGVPDGSWWMKTPMVSPPLPRKSAWEEALLPSAWRPAVAPVKRWVDLFGIDPDYTADAVEVER